MTNDLDVFGLVAGRRHTSVRIGPAEIGAALIRASMNNALNRMPDGNFVVDFSRSPATVDYFGELTVLASQRGSSWPSFTGSIINAAPTLEGVEISAVGIVSLSESITPGMISYAVSAPEMVYVIARNGGLRDEKLRIAGLEGLTRETFEVVVPVDGVMTDAQSRFAEIQFIPVDTVNRSLDKVHFSGELRSAFDSPVYAMALVTANRILEAEEKGLAEIRLALAWLTTQLRYGLASRPDGTLLPFNRRESLSQPTVGNIVYVRGLTTSRQWLRRPQAAKQARFVDIVNSYRPLDRYFPQLSLQDRQAILAFSRAAHEQDPLAQVQALWEAIEFYTSGVSVENLFTKAERQAILDSLPSLRPEQLNRVKDVVSQLNSAPLGVRLRDALDDENVPVSDGEIDLLWKLRKLRNDVVHGRRSELPATEDVEYAVSIVARMLVYRVARCSTNELH
jgi:hypothetical protein